MDSPATESTVSDVELAASADRESADQPAKLELAPSRQFPNWLAEQKASLAFTTYQAGKLFLIGLQPDGRRRSSSAPSTAVWGSAPTVMPCG